MHLTCISHSHLLRLWKRCLYGFSYVCCGNRCRRAVRVFLLHRIMLLRLRLLLLLLRLVFLVFLVLIVFLVFLVFLVVVVIIRCFVCLVFLVLLVLLVFLVPRQLFLLPSPRHLGLSTISPKRPTLQSHTPSHQFARHIHTDRRALQGLPSPPLPSSSSHPSRHPLSNISASTYPPLNLQISLGCIFVSSIHNPPPHPFLALAEYCPQSSCHSLSKRTNPLMRKRKTV